MIDLHCDTIMYLLKHKEKGILQNNDFHVDIEKLKKSNSLLQCFAIFPYQGFIGEEGIRATNKHELVVEMADRFFEEVDLSDDLELIRSYIDIEENIKKSKISALLTIEGAGSIDDDMERIDFYYDLGVRLITLTWNYVNCLGFPNDEENMNKGLTEFGIKAIKKMNDLGIIIDVSHLSDAGFWDVVKYSNKPFIASHSNARSVTNHRRNLTDDMIKAISDKGGVIGINFCPMFVSEDKDKMLVKDLVTHIKHIKEVGGIDCIGLGTDFDGIGGDLETKNMSEMYKLKQALHEAGFSYEDIDKIWYKNSLRLMKEVLK